MNINQLEYFLTLVETLNYTAAAAELDISQPGLYRSISALEEELDTTLFEKRGRNIALSRGGEIFVPHARKIISQLHMAENELKDLKDSEIHPINLAVAIDYDINLFSQIINAYMQKHPNKIKFQITQIQLPGIINMLKQNDAEFGFSCISYALAKEDTLTHKKLKPEKYCCFMSKENPLASRESLMLSELHDEVFIFYSEYARTMFSTHMKNNGYDIRDYGSILNKDAIFSLVEGNVGVCIAGSNSQYNKDKIIAIELQDSFANFYNGLVWKQDRQFSKEASDFRKFVIENYSFVNC
ncbi:MAG: LysR family transcriptional regulator [Firmicutes bacterium]|nr:LysR family transcriptional regulator [Bacillota bacterium]